MCFLNFDCCTDNSLCLHLSNLRICDCKTASTMTHHWVELMQAVDDSLDLFYALALCISKFLDVSFLCRNELMQRWIQETDCYRVTLKCLIKSLEVRLLIWKNLLQCSFSLFYSIRADHLTECSNSVFLEEHMLCTAKTNTLSTKLTSFLSICRCISVCTNLQCSELVSPLHNAAKLTSDLSIYSRNQACIDVTCCTIDRDFRSLCECLSSQCELLVLLIHVDIATTGYAACTHTTSNYGCMRCHTTTNCQDTLGCLHTCNIFWRSLKTN